MRKISFAIAAGAMAFSGAAMAQTLEFDTRGECQRWVSWNDWYAKHGQENPLGVLPPNPKCEKIGSKWRIVAG